MPKAFVIYQVWYELKNENKEYQDNHGPWDYAGNARERRNQFFEKNSNVSKCWIYRCRKGIPIGILGKVLERK